MASVLTFKVVIIGDAAIGKTCLIKRFHTKQFSANEEATIAA